LATWFGDWDKLEMHHGYVQWLFPIREGGLNFSAQPLSKFEASQFRKNPEIMKRIIKSYELMLDFYGIVLKDRTTGALARNPKTFKNRYAHLNNSFHNYLRITRILKFLGIVGLEHYKKQFLRHLIIEVFKHEKLSNADESCVKYWMPTVRKSEDLKELDLLVEQIIGKKVPREKLGYGDEEGENWATQFYAQECDIPNDDLQPQPQVPQDAAPQTTTTTTTTIDVDTYPYDPYEAVHKKFESQMSQRSAALQALRFRQRALADSDDESNDLPLRATTRTRSHSDDEADTKDIKRVRLQVNDNHFQAASRLSAQQHRPSAYDSEDDEEISSEDDEEPEAAGQYAGKRN
jgi:hypothetical protein